MGLTIRTRETSMERKRATICGSDSSWLEVRIRAQVIRTTANVDNGEAVAARVVKAAVSAALVVDTELVEPPAVVMKLVEPSTVSEVGLLVEVKAVVVLATLVAVGPAPVELELVDT